MRAYGRRRWRRHGEPLLLVADRPGLFDGLAALGRLAYRHRSELAPLTVATILDLAALWLHSAHPNGWPWLQDRQPALLLLLPRPANATPATCPTCTSPASRTPSWTTTRPSPCRASSATRSQHEWSPSCPTRLASTPISAPESPSNSPPSTARKISSSTWSATPTGRKTRSPHGSGRSGTSRSRLARQLDETEETQLDEAGETLAYLLDLLADPRELYRQAGKSGRRALNQALFVKIFLDADGDGPYVARDELAAMVAPLVDVARHPGDERGAVLSDGATGTGQLLRAALADAGSSKPPMVELRGLEPLTPTLPVWCATSCATAPCTRRVAPGHGGNITHPGGRVGRTPLL
jgi:hypothetical protein